jgi:HD-like signal output (HDOD) protein
VPPQSVRSAGEAVPADQLRSLRPIITREQILEQVDRVAELKALSPTVAQLIDMTGNPDCSLEQVARVIKRDQAIALRVLKVANSVMYKRGEPVDTVQKALSRIGVTQIRQVVLNMSVIDSFRANGLDEWFNNELFWEHSIATGLIAAAITRSRRGDEQAIESAFTLGLLHDVARMVFAEQIGDMYKSVLETATRLQLPLEQVETRMLLVNHVDLMDRILTAWKFPKAMVEPIGLHHISEGSLRKLSPQMITEAGTLVLANRLAHAMLLGSSGNESFYATDEFVRMLELKPEVITRIENEIPEQTTDMKYAMLQSASGTGGQDYHRIVLRRFQRPMRPLFVSAEPEIDGYRMLFEKLKQPSGDRGPNVAVIHMASVRERESLCAALLNAEKSAGVEPLPLIVISSLSTLKLEPGLLAGRMHAILPSPLTLSRLAETVNELLPPEDGAE